MCETSGKIPASCLASQDISEYLYQYQIVALLGEDSVVDTKHHQGIKKILNLRRSGYQASYYSL